jgi:hypothetical protein
MIGKEVDGIVHRLATLLQGKLETHTKDIYVFNGSTFQPLVFHIIS